MLSYVPCTVFLVSGRDLACQQEVSLVGRIIKFEKGHNLFCLPTVTSIILPLRATTDVTDGNVPCYEIGEYYLVHKARGKMGY